MSNDHYKSPMQPTQKIRWSDSPSANRASSHNFNFSECDETLSKYVETELPETSESQNFSRNSDLFDGFSQKPSWACGQSSSKPTTPKRPNLDRNREIDFTLADDDSNKENLNNSLDDMDAAMDFSEILSQALTQRPQPKVIISTQIPRAQQQKQFDMMQTQRPQQHTQLAPTQVPRVPQQNYVGSTQASWNPQQCHNDPTHMPQRRVTMPIQGPTVKLQRTTSCETFTQQPRKKPYVQRITIVQFNPMSRILGTQKQGNNSRVSS